MKILINGVSAVTGGGVTYLNNLSELLPKLAPTIDFIFALPPGISLSNSGKNIIEKHIEFIEKNIVARMLWENFLLADFCVKENIDLLFCPANIIPLKKPSIPIVSMVRNVAPFYPQIRRLLFKYEGLRCGFQMGVLKVLSLQAVKSSNIAIYLSNATKQLIEKHFTKTRYKVLYHGINQNFFPRNKTYPSNKPESPFFVFVSNIYVYKGLEFLLQAYKEFPDLPPTLVIGKILNPGYVNFIKKEISKDNLNQKIQFIGDRPYPELPEWYSKAIAMVYPSWCENCPNVLLEAMACGCPIVCMKIGPMPEICGIAAKYAKPFNGHSLGVAMKEIIKPEENSRLRKLAIQRASEFSWHKSIKILLEAFSEANTKII